MESTTSSPGEREQRFRELYDAVYVDLLRFARRRVHPTHAEDVVGEVLLVAWRRLDDVPDDLSVARAWLFGVARKTLQNTRRRENRYEAVAVRLADVRHSPADAGDHPDLVAHRVDIAAAWPPLSALHQEAIALVVFEGLTAPEAAAVLGISSAAFRLRLPVPAASCGGMSTPPPSATACLATLLPKGAHDEQAHHRHHEHRRPARPRSRT